MRGMVSPKNGRERIARSCRHRAGRLGRLSDGAGLGYRALATLHSGSLYGNRVAVDERCVRKAWVRRTSGATLSFVLDCRV